MFPINCGALQKNEDNVFISFNYMHLKIAAEVH